MKRSCRLLLLIRTLILTPWPPSFSRFQAIHQLANQAYLLLLARLPTQVVHQVAVRLIRLAIPQVRLPVEAQATLLLVLLARAQVTLLVETQASRPVTLQVVPLVNRHPEAFTQVLLLATVQL